MAANVGRIRNELGISISIVSDEEVAAEKLEDDNAAAIFLIDTVLANPDKLAQLSQQLTIRKVEDCEAFLRSRRAGFVEVEPQSEARSEAQSEANAESQAASRRSRSAGVPREG